MQLTESSPRFKKTVTIAYYRDQAEKERAAARAANKAKPEKKRAVARVNYRANTDSMKAVFCKLKYHGSTTKGKRFPCPY